jgi:hypothetical protein
MSGDLYVDREDPNRFWQVLQFGVQNLYEWIRIDQIDDAAGAVELPGECATAASSPASG